MARITLRTPEIVRTIVRSYSSGTVPLSFYRTKDDSSQSAPVIFLHGLFGNKNNFKSVAGHITRVTGHTCYTVDLRNHGDSPHLSFNQCPAIEMAHDVAHFLTSQINLDLDHPSCYLVGHSMGGRVALQFADMYRNACLKIIPVDVSPCQLPSSMSTMIRYIECMKKVIEICPSDSLIEARKQADKLMQEEIKEKFVRDFLLLNLIRQSNESGQSKLAWKFNIHLIGEMMRNETIRQITLTDTNNTPTAFIYGGKSDFLTEQMKPEIMSMFPNSQFYCVPDAGHYLHVEKRDVFLSILTSLLR